jgi:hypothetical protein
MSGADLFVGMFELINHFRSKIIDARIEPRNVLLRRHMLDDMREHLPDFCERRLLCCHYAAIVPPYGSPA